ncbi:hypothetical protein RMN57_22855 [Kitasatospora sp. CM 4170]|uniref:Uncharacterized protein n=1 Tax=Kitasatospora aburaviensis TaxID=67265 RepID=A0ABW1EZ82_9ACTN|nr:hypothetical protein [Kitasatospora sp. CM 4170]WNM47333.1 hypothetical protein RMN57_22855 [Kitasatospora sp. CM 4170]
MATKDELATRRFRNLVQRLEVVMQDSLKPEYGGYYGQVVLGAEAIEELGALKEVRQAAREAGKSLGWKTVTHAVGDRLFVLDDREPPERIRQLADQAASDAIERTFQEMTRARLRLVAPPNGIDED